MVGARECDQWLGDSLRNGPSPSSEVFKAAIDAGYTRDQVKDAKHLFEFVKRTTQAFNGHMRRGAGTISSTREIGEKDGGTDSGRGKRKKRLPRRWSQSRPPMTIPAILAWADEHRRLTGRWPRIKSKPQGLPIGETWHAVHSALRMGLRGLEGGSSLAQVLAEHRGLRGPLTPERILAWADAHHAATGQWPTRSSGRVRGVERETWEALDFSLLQGRRGLPAGSSLPRLLAESRPVQNVHTLPRLTVAQILAWADAYFARTGRWPRGRSGRVADAPGETWGALESALVQGLRGLPGGTTVAQLLAAHRGAPAIQTSRPLTTDQILAWADAHHAATGRWPVEDSGPVAGVPGETWKGLSMALAKGHRGLSAGSSLARLLAEQRGARNAKALPRLTLRQIRAWARAHRSVTGRWPTPQSGSVAGAPSHGETWAAIQSALACGHRGLRGGLSLARVVRPARPPAATD